MTETVSLSAFVAEVEKFTAAPARWNGTGAAVNCPNCDAPASFQVRPGPNGNAVGRCADCGCDVAEALVYLAADNGQRAPRDLAVGADQYAPDADPPDETSDARAVDGAVFLEGAPSQVPALWGEDGGRILWSQGEALMLVGPEGVGKTSVAQQLVLARIGLQDELLGLQVKPASGRVLYVAADRPRQAASSMKRMIRPDDLDTLRARLVVWRGPLDFDLAQNRDGLVGLADQLGDVSDIVIDSLKDVAVDLTKDETGSRVNVAFQRVIASGRELVISHHQRKEMQGGGKPRRLTDVYGSRWLTAGMGSVVLLWGEPGDLVVELRHLKQPAEEVGPLTVIHDHARGATTIEEAVDLEKLLANSPNGVTVQDAAVRLFTTADPNRNEIEKARRRLKALVAQDRARRHDDPDGLARFFAPLEAA